MEPGYVYVQGSVMRNLSVKLALADRGTSYEPVEFIVEILKSVGLLPNYGSWTLDKLANLWHRTRSHGYGDLVFWDYEGHISHVELCIGHELAVGVANGIVRVRPIHSRYGVWGYTNPYGQIKE